MKADFSTIAFVLDKSGSMSALRDTAIEGFNKFVEEQKVVPGEAELHFTLFSDEIAVNPGIPLKDVVSLSRETYVPDGWTALYDAIGMTIDSVGKHLAEMNEEDRPSNVTFAILTDGHENRSTKFSHAEIAAKIKHQQEVYGWVFVFLGANINAEEVAVSMNIPVANSMTYAATDVGLSNAYSRGSRLTTSNRIANR